MLGLSSCRTHVAMSQGHHGNTAWHFSGAGATRKTLASRTCQSQREDCAFPSELAASWAALGLTHQARASCDVRADTPYGPRALCGPIAPCNISPPPLVLEGMETDTYLLGCCWSSACVLTSSSQFPLGCSRCDHETSHPALAASFSPTSWAFLLPLGV